MRYHGSYLDIFGELVVGEDVYGGELAYAIELEFHFDRLSVSGIVPPTDPALICTKSNVNKSMLGVKKKRFVYVLLS